MSVESVQAIRASFRKGVGFYSEKYESVTDIIRRFYYHKEGTMIPIIINSNNLFVSGFRRTFIIVRRTVTDRGWQNTNRSNHIALYFKSPDSYYFNYSEKNTKISSQRKV